MTLIISVLLLATAVEARPGGGSRQLGKKKLPNAIATVGSARLTTVTANRAPGADGLLGTCGSTTFPMGCDSSCTGPESPPIEAACNEALHGAWTLAENVTQAEAEHACRVGCVACANCAYVSVSFEQRECSWYSACDTSKLVKGAHGSTFQTHFVRELSRDSETSHESHAAEWRRHRMLGSKRIGGAPEQGPRIWVINTSVHECHNSRKGKDLFEEKLPALFRTGFLRAASLADADVIYHPACLVDAYFRLRKRDPRRLRAVESRVMREVEVAARATVKRTPVIVNSLRCYTRSPGVKEDMERGFPILWSGHRFLRFCMQAYPSLDSKLSLYIPYCPSAPWIVPPGLSPNFDRPVKVLFQGGVGTGHGVRLRAVAALNRTSGAKLVAIDNQKQSGQYDTLFRTDDERMAPMREATYTLCPPGDTPESQRIYQAISQGSIPLLNAHFQRPSIVNWSALSVPIRILPAHLGGGLALLNAEEQRAAQWEVWRERRSITCEASNPRFRDYVEKGLRQMLN